MIKAIIVDDEMSGREGLSQLLKRFCPSVKILDMCENIERAVEAIKKGRPDLVLLDIEMPLENGFKLFDYFPIPEFEVIFTTAHPEYAVQAFRYSAVDYILKPIDYRILVQAVEKVEQKLEEDQKEMEVKPRKATMVNPFRKIAIPTVHGYHFTEIQRIVRVQADANYSKIIIKEKKGYTSSKTLGEYENLLVPYNFVRVHRSHLVNLNFIQSYTKGRSPILTMEDGVEIPIASNRRDSFLNQLNKM